MTAIGAIFQRRPGERLERALTHMRDALHVYGPDRTDQRADGAMGLVWCQTIGFTPQDAHEVQPLSLGDQRWLVFDGRLDHRGDLYRALALPPAQSAAMPDGELVRRAWLRWGERTGEHLFGSYCVIVADAARHRLVALRGALSAPPLHYSETGDQLILASMTRGIFALGTVPRAINDERIADCLVGNFEDREASYFRHVRALPLGHMLVADPDRVSVSRWYDLRATPAVRFKRDEEYVEAADALLQAAVASAMRSIETPAIMLSSGLDSPSVAVTALEHLATASGGGKRLLGLVHVPAPDWDGRVLGAGKVGDESGPVRALAARYPALDVRFVDSAGIAIDAWLDGFQALADMPLRGIGNLYWNGDLAQHVRADGRRVALSGSSGNATISMGASRSVLAGLFRQGRWLRMVREVRARNLPDAPRRFGLTGLFGSAVLPHLPHIVYAAHLRRQRGSAGGWRSWSPIHPDFASAMRVSERIAASGWSEMRRPPRSRQEQTATMLDRGNRHQAGALSTAWEAFTGVQGRDPLGDRRIAEFCYAIPDEQYFGEGMDRRLVRRMMMDRLPCEILQAPRGVQGADWQMRLQRDRDRFLDEFEALSRNPAIAARLDLGRIRSALAGLPRQTPASFREGSDTGLVELGFGPALSVARFLKAFHDHAEPLPGPA